MSDNIVDLLNKAQRHNENKAPMHLLPWDALEEVAKVYAYGAKKYSARNWENGLSWNEGCAASLQRHLADWSMGIDTDEESGLHHDIHMAFNALALVTYRLRQIGEDDRPDPYGLYEDPE